MTREEFELFNALHESRSIDLQTFKKRSYQGIWKGVIDKYPESAHFIYELLQNADDAEATEVKIELRRDSLVFRHNGKIGFSVTAEDDPHPGHINSITSIGDSTKSDSQGNKIGKFGVGFKSVFQYTDEPKIYDDNFQFKIENYIVPTLLDDDYPDREAGETVFFFPFTQSENSYKDILSRLTSLNNPILFLTHLIQIDWLDAEQDKDTHHYYKKKSLYKDNSLPVKLEVLHLHNQDITDTLFLFTKLVDVPYEGSHAIKVGYFYDRHTQTLITNKQQNIFCFFPTRETFGTCYISHAPFKLVDSRQNIKENEFINHYLIDQLTILAADALTRIVTYGRERLQKNLIDANIWRIIPTFMMSYSGSLSNITHSESLLQIFVSHVRMQKLFLTTSDDYEADSSVVYARPVSIIDYFSSEQISQLLDRQVKLLSRESTTYLSNNEHASKFVRDYLQLRTVTSEDIAKAISAPFMENQELGWVVRFYSFLMNEASALWKPRGKSTDNLPMRDAPIILSNKEKWIPPYKDGQLNVYLPLQGTDGYNFVSSQYLDKEPAKRFFQELGIKEPDKLDYIKNIILPLYTEKNHDEHFMKYDSKENYIVDIQKINEHFQLIFDYYQTISYTKEEGAEFLNLLKNKYKLIGIRSNAFKIPQSLYYGDEKLRHYFGNLAREIINYNYYQASIDRYGDSFSQFLEKIGVCCRLQIKSRESHSESILSPEQWKYIGANNHTAVNIQDFYLDGFEEAIREGRMTKDVSIYVWEFLNSIDIEDKKNAVYKWRYHTWKEKRIPSTLILSLRNLKWIYGKNWGLYSPSSIQMEMMDEAYNRYRKLINALDIRSESNEILKLGGTKEQQDLFEFGKKCKRLNITEERLKHLLELEGQERLREEAIQRTSQSKTNYKESPNRSEEPFLDKVPEKSSKETLKDNIQAEWAEKSKSKLGIPKSGQKPSTSIVQPVEYSTGQESGNLDFGRLTTVAPKQPETSSYSPDDKYVTVAQQQLDKAKRDVDLVALLNETPKYTFLWFKYLGEILFGDKANTSKHEAEIRFSACQLSPNQELLLISQANTIIPKWIELADTLEFVIVGADDPIKLAAHILTMEETSMLLQLDSTSDDIIGRCRNCRAVVLKALSAQSIFNSLLTRFLQLEYQDDYDMNSNLPSDIEFIYGPPGTGKTTRLVARLEQILHEAAQGVKILVLAPTNKAADVIARKMCGSENCHEALTRFGTTDDTTLITEDVLRDRATFNFQHRPKNVIVTTSARYAYDGLASEDFKCFCDIPWDYVVIDEASMIDLMTIAYVLHKSRSSKFIISGDPKQIQPTGEGNIRPENIYQMIGLSGFQNAITSYRRFKVTALMTQYRAIPTLGKLVSDFAYDGLLASYRSKDSQKPLPLEGMSINDINFIAFPVREFDNLFGLSAVDDSAIHIYSAIFTYNFAAYIAKQVYGGNPSCHYSVGIVSPYRKQADIVQQLMDGCPIDTLNCSVQCGTVHSFQGDECDIMILLLNPPAVISQQAHVLNENIVNVGISRAKDYLFIVTPDTQDPKFVTRNRLGILSNTHRSILKCMDLERVIFGENNYIQNNTDIRCHMPVNVYADSWARYEVRVSDDAIDIRIRE